MEEIQRVYPKYKKDPNDKDALEVLQSVTDFILHLANSLKATWSEVVGQENTNAINLHFVFIVPTEWEYTIREDIIRPIFIAAGLISNTDHPNRLLLFTKLESVIQLIQHPKFGVTEKIKVSTQYIMCSAVQLEDSSIIKFDAFEFEHCGIGLSSSSTLVPRVSKSVTLKIDFKKVKTSLKKLIQEIGIPQENISDEGIESVIKRFLSMEVEFHKNNLSKKTSYPFKKLDQNEWRELSSRQLDIIRSITLAKIYENIFVSIVNDLESSIQEVLSYSFSKIRSLITIKEAFYDGLTVFPSLFEWISIALNNIGRKLNYNMFVFTDNRGFLKLRSASIIEGASRKMLEKIKISDAIIPPNVIRRDTLEDGSTASILHKDDPDIVITIAPNVNIPTTLKVERRIISFLEEHLDAALQYFTKYDRRIEKKKFNNLATRQKTKHYVKIAYKRANICKLECCKRSQRKENIYETHELFSHMTQIRLRKKTKDLLGDKVCSKKSKLQTQQKKYIKAFLVMYFGYLNQLIKDQSAEYIEYENKTISHVLLLEKRLLRSIIGTKKELKELLIASDLFQNEVKTKKLKIITHGEGILPALQHELGINLALKSYYVLSQLHTTYIQVTLYQVVQTTEMDEEASAIIIQNETLPIESIYDSLCKYMWTHAELDKNLIQCCTLHQEGFSSLKNHKFFTTKVKAFIVKKVVLNCLLTSI
ncbi:hypothetical protein INT48_002188 [Thamnidium elegans]|uniref:Uncharacterized protein n=1 Tax=Thamnidium elegans TaxID=101142 RepID=A0A8H7SVL0_9FUNG|nr:hypothetical protein INT48_002188 [Thamnidium elegans]